MLTVYLLGVLTGVVIMSVIFARYGSMDGFTTYTKDKAKDS